VCKVDASSFQITLTMDSETYLIYLRDTRLVPLLSHFKEPNVTIPKKDIVHHSLET